MRSATSQPNGFVLRDAAASSDFSPFENGQSLGISLAERDTVCEGHRLVDIVLRSHTEADRAVTLRYQRRVQAKDILWLQDPRRSIPVEPPNEYTFAEPTAAGAAGLLSRYPFAAVAADGQGHGLGIDMEFPAVFRAGFDAAAMNIFLAWEIALTKEKPEARLRLCEFTFQPEWGFRAALERWHAIFPEQFRSRTPKHGLWMPFFKISQVRGWEDFGFVFKEGDNETEWDHAHGMTTFHYTEPMTWWMKMEKDVPRTMEAALRQVEQIEATGAPDLKRKAAAFRSSGMTDETGAYAALFRNYPWCDGVVWSMNSMPGIPGENDFSTKWNAEIKRRLYGPAGEAALGGEYIDSTEGYSTCELDFRRDHFAAADTPLTFSRQSLKPAVFRGLVIYEYTRAMARDVHGMEKRMMGNGTPDRLCWLAPWLDVMGTEADWIEQGQWKPMSDAELLVRRALSGPKPFCFLMNTDFDKLSPELIERYMMRAVAFGMFPGFFSQNASGGHYFSRPDLYDRDRPLFKKYIPICAELSQAGWRPVTGAWSDNEAVHLERFGKGYLTVFNDSAEESSATITVPGAPPDNSRDLITGNPIVWTTAASAAAHSQCAIRLRPQHLAVIRLSD